LKIRISKLEMYIDSLNVLGHRGPLKLKHIMYKANINCSILNEYLDFLIQQSLIEKRIIEKERIVFAITKRGMNVLKYFGELTKALPIIEETRIQTTPMLYPQTNRHLKLSRTRPFKNRTP
jgi:predicted transcriptional regulator